MPYEYKKSDFKYQNIQHNWEYHATLTTPCFLQITDDQQMRRGPCLGNAAELVLMESAENAAHNYGKNSISCGAKGRVYMTDLSRTVGQPDTEKNSYIVTNLVQDSVNFASLSSKSRIFPKPNFG